MKAHITHPPRNMHAPATGQGIDLTTIMDDHAINTMDVYIMLCIHTFMSYPASQELKRILRSFTFLWHAFGIVQRGKVYPRTKYKVTRTRPDALNVNMHKNTTHTRYGK